MASDVQVRDNHERMLPGVIGGRIDHCRGRRLGAAPKLSIEAHYFSRIEQLTVESEIEPRLSEVGKLALDAVVGGVPPARCGQP